MDELPTSKPIWLSKTLWFNVLSLIVVMIAAAIPTDLVQQSPKALLWLAFFLAVGNAVLRLISTQQLTVAILLALLLTPAAAEAQVQICSPQKLAVLRGGLPATVDPQWQALFHDPTTVFYTKAEMPPAFQFSITHGTAQFFHDARNNVSADASDAPLGDGFGGNANVTFPWRNVGGVMLAAEKDVSNFAFFRLPRRDRHVWPIVYWHEMRPGVISGPHRVLNWSFPVGTTFGEVVQIKDSAGKPHTFEVRLRFRHPTTWGVEVLRPYPTAGDLIKALDKMGDQESLAVSSKLQNIREVAVQTLTDKHRTRHGFNVRATNETLPPMSESLVRRLLAVPFRTSAGVYWRETASREPDLAAPTSAQRFGLVPFQYNGAFLGNDSQSCRNCHKDVLTAARSFDSGRGWYGFVRGGNEILSWNPVEPSSVSRDGGNLPVVFRRSFVSAGMWEAYNAAKHPADRYTSFK